MVFSTRAFKYCCHFVLSIMAIIFAIGSIVISIMALVYCVQDSEKGTNQYGPNPKEHMHEA
ncbi:hypothetical protein ACO2FJ_05850 [Staphylococcus warneri]